MEEELYYLSSENKGDDQLRGYREADLRLCFRICRLLVFSRGGSFCTCKNKDADHCTADHCLYFGFMGSVKPVLLQSEISSFYVAFFCDCTGWFVLDLVRNRDIAHMLCFSYRFDQPLSTNTQFDIRERSKRMVCWLQTEATHGSQRLVFSMNISIMHVMVKNYFILPICSNNFPTNQS